MAPAKKFTTTKLKRATLPGTHGKRDQLVNEMEKVW